MDIEKTHTQNDFEIINCPVCGCAESKTIYEKYQETGYTLGRILTSFVVCDCCSFMYQNPRPTLDVLQKHYAECEEASGAVYHDVDSGSLHDEKQKQRYTFYKKYLDTIPEGDFLEVGCSTGDYLLSLDLPGWNITGMEPSIKAANQARAKGLNIICASLEANNLADEYYDVISCFSVLEHLHDINSALLTITRSLKNNGLLCIEVPDTMKPVPQISEFFTFEHMSHFTKETLIIFLERYGYSDFHFDEEVQDSRLRVCARKTANKSHIDATYFSRNRDVLNITKAALIEKVRKYEHTKNILEKEILKRLSTHVLRWKKQGKKVAIYGAGMHTRYLMNLFDLSSIVTAILDSDPNKRGKKFLRWDIEGEELLSKGKVDSVIISSKAFEKEIYKRIKKYSTYQGVEILCCYNTCS